MYAPNGAVAVLSSLSRLDGIHEIRWALADGSKVTTLEYTPHATGSENMAAGPTLLQRTWDMLDMHTHDLLSNLDMDPMGRLTIASKARAIAEVLAMFMPPHFATADDIAREAKRRWLAKQNGETYETPGLGSRAYEPPPGSPIRSVGDKPARKTTVKKVASSTGKLIPDSALENVRKALDTKMFTVAMVAKTYGMTEPEVVAQLGLPT